MPSISDEDIQKVRAATDIVALFSERTPVKQRGRDYWCCCPFHNEKTPSCKIDPATQQFYCFGCHEHGDVFSYVMKTEDVDFPDAVRTLADRAHIELHETGGRRGPSRGQKERLRQLCRDTEAFYHTQLMRTRSPETDAARAYLGSRGLGGPIPKKWMLGFAPGRGALIRYLRGRGYSEDDMVQANVAMRRDGGPARDRFFNRIMFPIHDERGECIAFGGRVVGTGEPKYLNSSDTPLFHKSNVLYGMDKAKAAMTTSGEAIVVEGYTDVIALHEAGVTNAVATLGTALTTQHIRLLARHAGRRIVYLFDGDEAGQRATDRALEFIDESMTPEAGGRRIDLMACRLPDDLDPADFVAQRGADALRDAIAAAKPLIAFGIDLHISRFDTSNAEGRTAAFADTIKILAPIKDSLLAKDYAVQIGGRLNVKENDALDALARMKPPRRYDTVGSGGAGRQQKAVIPLGDRGAQAPAVQPKVEYGAVPTADAGAPPAMRQPVRLSETEVNRRRFEAAFLGLCAHYPAIGVERADVLAQTAWHVPLHARVADALLEALSNDQSVEPAAVAGAVTQKIPQAAALFVERESDARDPYAYANYLADELALGDMGAEIEAYRQQLAHPEGLSEDEANLLYETVSSLQNTYNGLFSRHRRGLVS